MGVSQRVAADMAAAVVPLVVERESALWAFVAVLSLDPVPATGAACCHVTTCMVMWEPTYKKLRPVTVVWWDDGSG